MKVLPAKQATGSGAVHYALNTLYKWHAMKQHPSLLFKVNGTLMIDLDEYQNILIRARDAHVKTAERMASID